MSESEVEADIIENVAEVMDYLAKELEQLYSFRNLYFENHPIEKATEKNEEVEKRKNVLIEKFESLDVMGQIDKLQNCEEDNRKKPLFSTDSQIPSALRAQFLYLKGRCYNISPTYDSRATQCLSKAVKWNPRMVDAWNELGECYWKNMNVKEARASFEAALKHERNRLALRCLSIILRQESGGSKRPESTNAINQSVELAKEAVAQDTKDGISWTVLGNAYLCQFFMVSQDPAILKLCMTAYRQAWADPIAKGQPDLYYNKAIALKYDELYDEALENFECACRLDPPWESPQLELKKLKQYLSDTNDLVRTKGKIKIKKLTQMVQSLDEKMLGIYAPEALHTFGTRRNVSLELSRIEDLHKGVNEGKVILGRVVGSIHNESAVPFTFAIVDRSMQCASVTVYNWASGRGAIIGDCVTIPEPLLAIHKHKSKSAEYEFKSIRVNNPMTILVNGKRVGRNQFACTQVSSTYEIH